MTNEFAKWSAAFEGILAAAQAKGVPEAVFTSLTHKPGEGSVNEDVGKLYLQEYVYTYLPTLNILPFAFNDAWTLSDLRLRGSFASWDGSKINPERYIERKVWEKDAVPTVTLVGRIIALPAMLTPQQCVTFAEEQKLVPTTIHEYLAFMAEYQWLGKRLRVPMLGSCDPDRGVPFAEGNCIVHRTDYATEKNTFALCLSQPE